MELLGLLAIPLIIASLTWIVARDTITRAEFFAQLLISALLIGLSWSWASGQSLEDVEHLSGKVSAKKSGEQACCHCHTECVERNVLGFCKRAVERCSHDQDYYWRVEVEGAGALEQTCMRWRSLPEWWSEVHVGQPGVVEHPYQNYLRADPDSLMLRGFDGQLPGEQARREAMERYGVPAFPALRGGVSVDRVVALDPSLPAPPRWQAQLDQLNARIGASKQVDVRVVLGTRASPELALAIDSAWLGGPKNGAIVVLGSPDRETVAWARLVSFSQNPDLEIALRERLRGLPLHDAQVMQVIAEEVEAKFERTPMSTLAYLQGSATPRGWALAGLYLFALLGSLGLSYLFHRLDLSREGRRRLGRKGMWIALFAGLIALIRRRGRPHMRELRRR